MTTFLFWNINKKPLEDRIARLAINNDVDVIVLAECKAVSSAILGALNQAGGSRKYTDSAIIPTKIRMFSSLPPSDVQERYADSSGELSIWNLNLGGPPGVLLAGLHLTSKMNWSNEDQASWQPVIMRRIEDQEGQTLRDRTIIVGDFNMNPFDPGMIAATGFHGVMTLELARSTERTIRGQTFRFFYNPMWGLFGDRTEGPPGTFYLSSSKPVNYFWHIYDQVIVRPGLAEKLKGVKIIDHDGVESLVTKSKRPAKDLASDHLPILFELDL